MSVSAAGYILNVPSDRRELLLDEAENGGSFYRSTPFVAEPVSNFEHGRRAPLWCSHRSKAGKSLTLQTGRKASRRERDSLASMQDLKALARPITFDELKAGVAARVRAQLKRVLTDGGLLPPKTLGAFVDRIVELDASVAGRLARFSERRREALR
jgi:hypothetical protein